MCILGLCQNLIAVFLSKFLHITPLLGFMCGAVSMEGGHGYSLAFGTTIESIGIENAVAIGNCRCYIRSYKRRITRWACWKSFNTKIQSKATYKK